MAAAAALVCFCVAATPALAVHAGDIFTVSPDRIVAVDPATGQQRLVTNSAVSRAVGGGAYLQDPYDIEIGPNGTLYVADQGAEPDAGKDAIIGVDPSTGRQWLVSTNEISQSHGGAAALRGPRALAVERNGHLLVSSTCVSPNCTEAILDIDPATGIQRVISDGQISQTAGGGDYVEYADGIEEMSNGDIATDTPDRAVEITSRTSGAQSLVAQGNLLDAPGHSDLAGNDELLIASGGDQQDPRVIGVSMRTGAQRVVVPNLRDGEAYLAPVDVGMQQDGQLALAMVHVGPFDQYLYSSVFRFDPATGVATKLSGDDLLFGVRALTVYRDPSVALPPLPSSIPSPGEGEAPQATLSPGTTAAAPASRKCRHASRHRGKRHRCHKKRPQFAGG